MRLEVKIEKFKNSYRARSNLVVREQLHDEGGDGGGDPDEQVEHDHSHIRGARLAEVERARVHDGRDGPATERTQK